MKSFSQASSEFSSKTDLKEAESALVKKGLAFLGTNSNDEKPYTGGNVKLPLSSQPIVNNVGRRKDLVQPTMFGGHHQRANLGHVETCEIATWLELPALGIQEPDTTSEMNDPIDDLRTTLKVNHEAMLRIPDLMVTTAAEVL
eukprot:Em0017g679a